MYSREYLLSTGYFLENEYFEKYLQLIINNSNIIKESFKTNKHHIIPRHYYSSISKDVDNSKNNVVNLTYMNHMLAHMYLSGCTIGKNKYWNLYAVFYMSGKTSITIEELENNLPEYQKLYEEAINAAPNHRKGTKISEETRQRMKDAQSRLRIENGGTNKGYIWVHNDKKDYMIPSEELDLYIENGFEKGRLFKHSEQWKKEQAERSRNRIITDEFRQKMSKIASNQIHTEEQNKKHSESLKKYYETHEHSMKGKHHSEETKRKLSESCSKKYKCPYCDYESTKSWITKHINKIHNIC